MTTTEPRYHEPVTDQRPTEPPEPEICRRPTFLTKSGVCGEFKENCLVCGTLECPQCGKGFGSENDQYVCRECVDRMVVKSEATERLARIVDVLDDPELRRPLPLPVIVLLGKIRNITRGE